MTLGDLISGFGSDVNNLGSWLEQNTGIGPQMGHLFNSIGTGINTHTGLGFDQPPQPNYGGFNIPLGNISFGTQPALDYSPQQVANDIIGGGLTINSASPSDNVLSGLDQNLQNMMSKIANQNQTTTTTPTDTPAMQAYQNMMNSYTNLMNEAKSQAQSYLSANPFNFDDYLAGKATQQAHQTLDPYYQQQLGYYLSGVTNNINKSQTGLNDTLNQLQTSLADYTALNKLQSARDIYGIQQQNEQNGLGSSGSNLRDQGQAGAGYALELQNQANQTALQQAQARHQTGFDIANILNQSNAQQQQMAQNNAQGVQDLATQLAQNKQQSWQAGLLSQPGVSALSGMGGGFNIMKQLGIGG